MAPFAGRKSAKTSVAIIYKHIDIYIQVRSMWCCCKAARGSICQTAVQGLPHIAHQQDGFPLQLKRDWDSNCRSSSTSKGKAPDSREFLA